MSLNRPGHTKPFQARVQRGAKRVSLGRFATAEEAAVCVAQSPEGQARREEMASLGPASRPIAQRKRECIEQPELEAARIAKHTATCEKRREAKWSGLPPAERAKKELERGRGKRAGDKRKSDLALLRTIMPEAKATDVRQARREGRMPKPSE